MAESSSLICLSWNLAMLGRSQEAPPDWTQEHVEAAVRELLLEWSPDVVVLQELPGLVPYVETHDMVRANPRSHSGNLATLLGNHLLDEEVSVDVVERCALLVTFAERDLTIANVHLAPGGGAAGVRLAQLQAVLATAPTDHVLVLGDTNTRRAEEVALAALGLGAPRPPEPTWDGRRNPFNGPSGEFVAYFTRALTAGAVNVTEQRVRPGRIEADGRSFHLSDHFALEVDVRR
ncbi:MAG: hypothetical protein AAGA93_27435 [Actinomycetota bacterium]